MGIDRLSLELIERYIKGARILCLGYPDLVMPIGDIHDVLGVVPRKFTNYGAAHKLSYPLAETVATLLLAGAHSVLTIDANPSRGVELKVDLNELQHWTSRYDLVIDGGTLEHCFNFGQAIDNTWRATDEGGHVIHISPLTMVNHGFFNINPTLWEDFYAQNGGKILKMVGATLDGVRCDVKATARFVAPANAVLYTVVEKLHTLPLVWPQQTRYKNK